ncbi:S-ribonuclease binding protein SBP1 [Forsythia ovata]|uniref:S-ribonuclease binding protein SBP1 n=1 Tax=Forsythia ovata TaxID=205694 RepID=A0ABD1P8H2_9LAMI
MDLQWNFGLKPKEKRPKEQDFLENNSSNDNNNNSTQISLLDFLQSVSTGLGLSLDNSHLSSLVTRLCSGLSATILIASYKHMILKLIDTSKFSGLKEDIPMVLLKALISHNSSGVPNIKDVSHFDIHRVTLLLVVKDLSSLPVQTFNEDLEEGDLEKIQALPTSTSTRRKRLLLQPLKLHLRHIPSRIQLSRRPSPSSNDIFINEPSTLTSSKLTPKKVVGHVKVLTEALQGSSFFIVLYVYKVWHLLILY